MATTLPSRRLLAACAAVALCLPVVAAAYNVYRIGGDGVTWDAAVSATPGRYLVLDAAGNVQARRDLTSPQTFPTWGDTLTELIDSAGGTWLRPVLLPDTLNLAKDGVRDRIKRGISNNIITSGTCYNNISQVTKTRPMFDGDPTTAAFYTANASDDPEIQRGFYIQNTIVDLGVDYPVNRIRFYPRLGRSNPKFHEIVNGMASPGLDTLSLLEEDFSGNYLPWFELAGAAAVNNFAANCYWQTATSPFFRHIDYVSNPEPDARWEIIRHETENLEVVVDVRFPTKMYQWVTFRPLAPIRNWEIAEFQVFGEGYVPRAVYQSAVLDFGAPVTLGRIRWDGARDPQSKVLVRTRTGTDPDPQLYWAPSAVPGELRQISRPEWERADITARQVTLDEEHWSFWSSPYEWENGQALPDVDPAAWVDGTPIRSPGPRRYLQLQLVFLSGTHEAARLRQLEVQFSPPVATAVVGEVWPVDAPAEGSTRFTYSVLPTLEDAQRAFDRLEIFTLTRADAVRAVRVDGADVTATHVPEIQEDRIVVSLPRLVGPEDTHKLVEVEFDTRVVRYGTEFVSWVYDSQSSGVRQLVEAGEANLAFPGNTLGVRTENAGKELIAGVVAAPNPFTPNGDGINDAVVFRFQVRELSAPRQLDLTIYDLSGRVVRRLQSGEVVRGIFGESGGGLAWDGLDDAGSPAPAGLYLYRIFLQTDSGDEERLGTLALAY